MLASKSPVPATKFDAILDIGEGVAASASFAELTDAFLELAGSLGVTQAAVLSNLLSTAELNLHDAFKAKWVNDDPDGGQVADINAGISLGGFLTVYNAQVLNAVGAAKSKVLADKANAMLGQLGILQGILQGLATALPQLKPQLTTVGNDYTAFISRNNDLCASVSNYLACATQACGTSSSNPGPTDDTGDETEIDPLPVSSLDPNDKVGANGVGPSRFTSGQQAVPYSVYFENQPTATAPAQAITITDTLNTNLDLNTLTLRQITFLTQVVTPSPIPLSVSAFAVTVDLRPANNLLVRINASLNTSTGVVTWSFQSLDPATNQPPTDPLAGFLPPGAEGSVFFTVMPKPTVTTGTVIQNTATVVFDVNPPINTPTWANTIDNTNPTSKVSALPPTELLPSFTVQWSGTDVGAGIQDFTIYVSDNGGPFTAWLTNTTATQGTYTGLGGHTYSFYSIARDLVGNVEKSKSTAEATTTVSASTCAIDVTPQFRIIPGGFRFNNATQRFVQTVTLQQLTLTPIQLPLSLVLDNLSSNAMLFNKTGDINCAAPLGSPYINVPTGSATLTLDFADPSKAGISYVPRVLMGSGTR